MNFKGTTIEEIGSTIDWSIDANEQVTGYKSIMKLLIQDIAEARQEIERYRTACEIYEKKLELRK